MINCSRIIPSLLQVEPVEPDEEDEKDEEPDPEAFDRYTGDGEL
jgi:hypothetical protein